MSAARDLQESHLVIDEVLIECCQKAVLHTFESVFGRKPTYQAMAVKTDGPMKYEVTGVIGFVQEKFDGTLALGFKQDYLLTLMSEFYGETLTSIDEQVAGGVNELINIVYGMVKEHLNDRGFRLQMCLPVVIVGTNNTVFSALPIRKTRMNFSFDGIPESSFFLEFSLIDHA